MRLKNEAAVYQKTLAQYDGWLWVKKGNRFVRTAAYKGSTGKNGWRTTRVLEARNACEEIIAACETDKSSGENKMKIHCVERFIEIASHEQSMDREFILNILHSILDKEKRKENASDSEPLLYYKKHSCNCPQCPRKNNPKKSIEFAMI